MLASERSNLSLSCAWKQQALGTDVVPSWLPSTHEAVHPAQELPQEMVQGLQEALEEVQGGWGGQQMA